MYNRESVHLGLMLSVIGALVCLLLWALSPDVGLNPAARVEARAAANQFADSQRGDRAPAPSRVAVPAESAPCSLTWSVVSDADSRPLAGARLTVVHPGFDARSVLANADGVAHLALDGVTEASRLSPSHAALVVTQPGYLAMRFEGALPPSGSVIRLEPSGSVEVVVVTARGEPVVGFEVALLPPVLDGPEWDEALGLGLPTDFPRGVVGARTNAESDGVRVATGPVAVGLRRCDARTLHIPPENWRRRTDTSGRVRFSGLPLGSGYRFAMTRAVEAILEPAHEKVYLRVEGESLVVGSQPVLGLSGHIDAVAEEDRVKRGVGAGRIQLLETGSIFGVMNSGPTTIPPQVKLYKVSRASNATGKTLVSIDVQSLAVADQAGRFRFEDVAPGEYLVRAWWQRGLQDLHFASIGALLEPGGSEDLGYITATPGGCAEVTVALTDLQGRPLDPRIINAEEQPLAAFTVQTVPDSNNAADSLYEAVTVEFDRTYRVHGLLPGTLRLRPQTPPWPRFIEDRRAVENGGRGVKYDLRVPFQKVISTRVETARRFDLEVRVDMRRRHRLVVTDSNGDVPRGVEIWARALPDGTAEQLQLVPGQAAPHVALYEVGLPAGPLELLCHDNGLNDDPGTGRFARIEIGTNRDFEVLDIELRAGAAVEGRVADVEGRPIVGEVLQWTPEDWRSKVDPAWVYRARTDSDGRFRVSGLVPGLELAPSREGLELPVVGAVGAVTVELTMDRKGGGTIPGR